MSDVKPCLIIAYRTKKEIESSYHRPFGVRKSYLRFEFRGTVTIKLKDHTYGLRGQESESASMTCALQRGSSSASKIPLTFSWFQGEPRAHENWFTNSSLHMVNV